LFYLQLPITKDMMVLHFKKHNRYLTRDRVTILYWIYCIFQFGNGGKLDIRLLN